MAKPILSDFDFNNIARLLNLPAPGSDNEPVRLADLKAAIEGIAWKDNVRVASTANVSLATPGASMDTIALAASDRVLLKNQTAGAENGIYIWNGAAVPMTRSLDASTSDELESAVVTVDEGAANGGSTWRQTLVNFVLNTGAIAWAAFGTTAPAASESSPGLAEIATQVEVDAGADDARYITALKLATWAGRKLKYSAAVGDGSATSITLTHNLGTRDVSVTLYLASGTYADVICDYERPSTNSVTLIFAAPPAASQYRAVIQG